MRRPRAFAGNATYAANLRLTDCRCTGTLQLTGSHICNALIMDGTELTAPAATDSAEPAPALDGTRLHVGADILARHGFRCNGELRLTNAKIDLRHLQTRDLVLLPSQPPAAALDLSHARIGLLRDDPSTWPSEMSLDGLTYEALTDAGNVKQRLDWLRRDPRGDRPQTYGHLASVYRGAGRDDDARAVLLAGEQHRRDTLPFAGRLWGHLQNLTIGYGYRPGRAIACLTVLLIAGTIVFQNQPPRAAEAAKAPEFVALAYTADLILPVVDLGQQANYHARGATVWLAYFLILAGLLFATTITAAVARRLRRT